MVWVVISVVGLAGVAGAAGFVWAIQAGFRAVVPRLRRYAGPVWALSARPANRLPRAELPALAALGVLLIGSLWLLFGVMQDLIASDPLVRADHAVSRLLLSVQDGSLVRLAAWCRVFGSGAVIIALGGGAILWLDRQRAWRAMAYVMAAVLGAILFAAGLDVALQRPAPFLPSPGFGLLPFPGSHLAVLAALLGFVAIVIGRATGPVQRIGIGAVTLVFMVASVVARLYGGADYLSTALEAVAFGAAWAVVLGFAYVLRPAETVRPGGLAVVVIGLILGVGGLTGLIDRAVGVAAARPVAASGTGPAFLMARDAWLAGGWSRLPRRPLSLLGAFGRRFVLQYQGSPDALAARLHADGWVAASPPHVASVFGPLIGGAGPATLAVMPQFDDGLLPRLVMLRTGGGLPKDERMVFRLWRSDVMVPEPAGHFGFIWLGAVAVERLRSVAGVFTVRQPVRHQAGGRAELLSALGSGIVVQPARDAPNLYLAYAAPR